jgi:hypothetical protein
MGRLEADASKVVDLLLFALNPPRECLFAAGICLGAGAQGGVKVLQTSHRYIQHSR